MKKIIRAAGGLVINEKEEILLIFRRNFWDLPKGKIEYKELISIAAKREITEETGLKKLKIIKKLKHTEHEYYNPFTQSLVIKNTVWFLMKGDSNEPLIPQIEEDICFAKWVPQSQLKYYLNLTHANIKSLILLYLNKKK